MDEPPAKPKIFLSYARGDDEAFVERLYLALQKSGFDVWWDRISMPSRSLTFHQEIQDAIAARERLVLVIGPKAVASDYVSQEWQFALHNDKVVTPILRRGDYPLVPEELKLLHIEDFRDDARFDFHLDNLVRQLSESPPPLGKLIAVPSLPAHYLVRMDRLNVLRDALRADLDRPVVIGGASARVGMHGMGGIGKSVLAAALARDRKIREAFPEGLFWVGLGSLPDVPALQRRLHRDLGGDGAFATAHEGKEALKKLLANKVVLLILDDTWRRADVDDFDVLGPRCRALITTRDTGLLTSLGGVHHVVELLTDDEAYSVLALAVGVLREELPSEAEQIVRECGRLPLALALCGGLIRRGLAWSSVLQQLQQARIERIADRHAVEAQHQSLWHAIHVSVEFLATDERQRFLELAVFPPDETTPEAAIGTLWAHTGQLDDWQTQELLVMLGERSLVQLSGQSPRRQVGLHDLIYDYVQRAIPDGKALQEQLLAAYQAKCEDGWASGPNDGYFFEKLCWHLSQTGRENELKALLLDVAWMEAKLKLVGIHELVEDYQYLGDDSEMRQMHDALRLSAHMLTAQPDLLITQLHARLQAAPSVKVMLSKSRPPNGIRIRSRTPTLAQVGGPLEMTIPQPDGLRCLVSSMAGKRLIAGTDKAGIVILDVRTGNLLNHYSTHSAVEALAVSRNGRWIAAAVDTMIEIRGGEEGKLVAKMVGHTRSIKSIDFSEDGKRLISSSWDNSVRVWDAQTGKELRILHKLPDGPDYAIEKTCTLRGGLAITTESYVGNDLGFLRIWDIEHGRELQYTKCVRACSAVALSHNNQIVACGSSVIGLRISLSDLGPYGELVGVLTHNSKWIDTVRSLLFSDDDRWLIAGTTQGKLLVWEVAKEPVVIEIDAHTESVLSLVAVSDRRIASATKSEIKLWKPAVGAGANTRNVMDIEPHDSWVSSLAVTENGELLVSGSSDGTVAVWDVDYSRRRYTIEAHKHGVASIAVNVNTGVLVSGAGDGRFDDEVRVWELVNGKLRHSIALNEDRALSVAITSDGQRLVVGSIFELHLWRLSDGKRLAQHSFGGCKDPRGLCLFEDRLAAVGLEDGIIQLWDLTTGAKLRQWKGHDEQVCGLTTVAGNRLISASLDGSVKIWNITTGTRLGSLPPIRTPITGLATTPDGHLAATASRDGAASVWDIANQKEIANFTADYPLVCCAMSVDGHHLFVGDVSGRVHFLILESLSHK